MTEQEQKIAIGEICGWEKWDAISPIDRKTPIVLWTNRKMQVRCELPDYVHDLNCMWDAETWMIANAPEKWNEYVRLLDIWLFNNLQIPSVIIQPFSLVIHIPCDVKSVCFLKAMGKLKE